MQTALVTRRQGVSRTLSEQRHSWWWLIPLLLLVCWLGARGLNANAIWYDEWWSIYLAGGAHYGPVSPVELITRASTQPWQPPAHYLLLAVWGSLAGWSAYAGRVLSLLLGLLAVAWTYRVGHELTVRFRPDSTRLNPEWAGLGAAVALGTSALFVHYLHEIRTYSLYVLFSAVTLWSYWQLIAGCRSWRRHVICLLALVGLLYSHYFALLNIGAISLYHLLFVRKTKDWWRAPMVMFAAGVLFLPWFAVALDAPPSASVADPVLRGAALSPSQIIERLLFAFSNGNIVLLVLLALAAWRFRGARFAGFCLLVTVSIAVIGNLAVHVLSEMRYLIGLWPLLALLVGFGMAELAKHRISPALVLVAWAAGGIWASLNAAPLMVAFQAPNSDTYNNSYAGAFRELPWMTLRQAIQERAQPGDALAFHRPDAVWAVEGVFDYYFHDLPVRSTLLEALPGRDQDDEYLPNARQFISETPRVWLAVDKTLPATFRLREFRRALADDYVSCGGIFDLPNMDLDLYARIPSGEAALRFGDGIGLQVVELPRLVDDHDLIVTLGWSVAPEVPPNTYSVALHLVDAAGQLVAQADFGLPGSGFTCSPSSIDAQAVPSGTYALLVAVYNWSTGERLLGREAAGEPAQRLKIGEVEQQ